MTVSPRENQLMEAVLVRRGLVASAAILIAATCLPVLLDLGRRSLTVHMAQYVVLTEIATPLLMYGIAQGPARLPVPDVVRAVWRFLSTPRVAGPLDLAALVVLHLPPIYSAAISSPLGYALLLVALFLSALPLWWAAANAERIGPYGHVRVLAFVFLTAVATNFFGFFLMIASAPWYPVAADIPSWNWTPLRDQQTAGGVLVFVPDLVDFVVMGALFIGWLNFEERKTVEQERNARRSA